MTHAANFADPINQARRTRAKPALEHPPNAEHSANHTPISEPDVARMLDRLCAIDADVVFFPVRHHSPTCAALLGQWIKRFGPAAVLIEGPSDFNEHMDELLLEHEMPIAIYSYFRCSTGNSGAYYPFCEYSPEWIALRSGTEAGALTRFIDLPWTDVSRDERSTHRYADAELRRGRYVDALCERMQVENFDDLWDKLVESDQQLELDEYFQRVHSLCFHIRLWEHSVSVADRRREAFMAQQIAQTRQQVNGRVLVVTGGFHSAALAGRLEGLACPGIDDPIRQDDDTTPAMEDWGIALTPYSYDQLDNLTGYNAGMPSPGFYEQAWRQRQSGGFSHHPLLTSLVSELRDRGQILSTADLIAVETSALALAAIRGREHAWRCDLIDAVTSALIKDELEYGCRSPFVDAIHAVLRGRRRGRLADGTRMPPLVLDIQQQLAEADLEMTRRVREVELDLLKPEDLARSRVLHRLTALEIAGYQRIDGTDFVERQDLTRLWELWRLRWNPEFESSCIEASRYGTSLVDAVGARFLEVASEQNRDASVAAALLVQAAQAGIETMSAELLEQLSELIDQEPQFTRVGSTLGHLLFLYCFDEAFGTSNLQRVGEMLATAFSRCLWLLELVGQTAENDKGMIRGMRSLLETFRRTQATLGINQVEFVEVLGRVEQDQRKPPQTRGAAAGILWSLGAADDDQVLADLLTFAEPQKLGDFLAGLFALSREVAQRDLQLVQTIDNLLLEFGADDFQTALPSLRLAFTYFTPREKHHMLTTLFESLGLKKVQPLAAVTVDQETAAEALALEERLFEAIANYGLEDFNG